MHPTAMPLALIHEDKEKRQQANGNHLFHIL
jgi:hypothetical protein